MSDARIPLQAHFVWFGSAFPWVNVLAVRSAALRGGFEQVILHHDTDLSGTEHFRELVSTPRVTLRHLDLGTLTAACGPFAAGLDEVRARLRTPATRSDLARFALLYSEGGVYLDIDTVTLKSFQPLCEGVNAFCGLERIIYSARVRSSRDPLVRVGAYLKAVARDMCRRLPGGYRTFRRIEGLYEKLPNPAIVAARRQTRFSTECLDEMLKIPPEQQPLPNAIGPHLLQHLVPRYQGEDLAVHEPEVFFPLGPELSEHWFRLGRTPALDQVIDPRTVLVHWYGSVRTKHVTPQIDPDYVRAHRHEQLFSALAAPFCS